MEASPASSTTAIDIGSNIDECAHSSSRAEPEERPVRRLHVVSEHWPSSPPRSQPVGSLAGAASVLTDVITRIVIRHPQQLDRRPPAMSLPLGPVLKGVSAKDLSVPEVITWC